MIRISDMVTIGVTVFLSFLASWALIKPFFIQEAFESSVQQRLTELQILRERAFSTLEDLELDYRGGKISSDEYELKRSESIKEIASIAAEIQKAGVAA